MNLPDLIKLTNRLIATGEKHCDYPRVTKLADDYKIFITAENISSKLAQIETRETKIAFDQRIKLTKSITPAVAASLKQPFNKVARNDRIRKNIKLGNEARQKAAKDMLSTFYGSARKKARGLDYWMKTRFADLQFIDPNSWVVVEWDAVAPNQVIKPRPFEVSAHEAVNFFIANDDVKWLLVRQDHKFCEYEEGKNFNVPGMPPGGVLPEHIKPPIEVRPTQDGGKFTMYDEDFTLVYEQVSEGYQKAVGLAEGEQFLKLGKSFFVLRTYEPKIGYTTAFRIGYKRDEATNGRTFVNPWHDALCYFEKSLKTVSELDLTMTLHVFPAKFQYVPKCTGESKIRTCYNGRNPDGGVCGACNGAGYKPIHTSSQDVVLIPMPDNAEDMIDLTKLSATQSPPIDLVKWQNEYILQLEVQAHQAVFNSQMFVKKSGGIKTATEVEDNMQSIYDTLEPFTEKYSELWIDFVTTFGRLAGEDISTISVSHDFPADFKLKTSGYLLNERKAANESGAPSFFVDTIDDDLASIQYAGDGLGLQKYRVKKRFMPFNGSTQDEILFLLGSEYVDEDQKFLYSNFDMIFKEIENEQPTFYIMTNLKSQRQIVEAKLAQVMERIKQKRPALTINTFREAAPAGEGDNSGENAGSQQQNNNRNESSSEGDNSSNPGEGLA